MEVVLISLISVLLNKVHDHLKSPIFNHYSLTTKALKNLENLSDRLSTIVNVQKDAELRQVTDNAIIDWLKKLRDVAYNADDVLDIFATETLRRSKAAANRDAVLRFASDFFSWSNNPVLFRNRMGRRIKHVVKDLNDIADLKKYHLKELDGGAGIVIGYRDQTISFLGPVDLVVGRVTDKEKLVKSLLRSDDGGRKHLEVVVILGMGGVGKTTLAKLVYNDERVENRFAVRIWVCVSEDFNLNNIMRSIIEEIQKKECVLSDRERLQRRLREVIGGKRFLLVLDDVWKETVPTTCTPEGVPSNSNWETLKGLLVSGAVPGCKVLVTTRDKNVASVGENDELMAVSINTHPLGILPEEDCIHLFKLLAFGSGREENDELMEIGRRIVRKCGGLPLAVKILGGLMRSKRTIQEWESVEENDIWDIRTNNQDILPALKLSYNHLPLKSRFSFAYCSIFPKGYEFDRMELISQWIANGFILPSGEKELEELGREIFEDLLSTSLFQDPKEDDYGSIMKCKIHDLVHDFARSLIKEECEIFPIPKNRVMDKKIRYLSIQVLQPSEIPTALYEAKKLRTILSFSRHAIKNGVLVDVCKNFKFLRVLNLQMTDIEDVPLSIKNLKHLRYADFSYTRIKILPECTSCLLNLQTLRLNGCRELIRLPNVLKNLSCLRNLEIKACKLHSMPIGMEKLINLRVLTDFTVGRDGATLKELRELKLGSELSIWKLENTRNDMDLDSVNPNLSSKRDLTCLNLSWANIGNPETNGRDTDVLNALEPHSYLKKLKVVNYGGIELPTWITDSRRHLVEVSLVYCSNCQSLPAFGKLTKLEDLQLIGFSEIRNTNGMFYGSTNGFASLKRLSLSNMPNFEQWLGIESGPVFPELKSLTIRDCPLLKDMPQIPTLHRLDLWNCHAMILRCVANLTSLTILIICKIPNLKSLRGFENLSFLKKLLIVDCVDLKSFSSNAMQNLTSLKHMEITGCKELKSLPSSMRYLKSLSTLNIKQCVSLARIFKRLNRLTSLESIRIVESLHTEKWRRSGVRKICHTKEFNIQICNKHSSLSLWLRYPDKLQELRIHGDHGFIRFPDLQSGNIISICCCKDLNLLPDEVQKVSFLEDLVIRSCHKLIDLPANLGELKSLQSLSIIDCPSLTRLPGKLHAVQFLLISDCPLLERRCVEQGEDWPFISHIPRRRISSPSSQ